MSRHSTTNNELFYLTIRTSYSDSMGPVTRSRTLLWRAFGWEGTVDIDPSWRKLRYLRYRFGVDHFPFDPEDNERMYLQFEKK